MMLADVVDEDDELKTGALPWRIAVGDGRLKVVFDRGFRPGHLETLTVRPPERRPIEAFDLVRDPGETTDVSAANAETVRRLRAEVETIYRKAPPRRTARSAVSVDVEKQLRALGYIR